MNTFKKYIILSLLIVFLNSFLILFFFAPRFDPIVDSEQYASTILYVSGDHSAVLYPPRLIKPMPILIGSILLPIMTAREALIFQNVIFYFASTLIIFLLINLVYKNEKQAFYGTVLFSTAYPVLTYGFSPLTDFSGWFFYILCIYLTVKFFENPSIKKVL